MSEKTSRWAEIRNDYATEIENGFHSITIDAWVSGEDEEEGKVIAKVYGKWIAGEAHIFFDWVDPLVLYDEEALAAIQQAKEKMLTLIKSLNI